MPLFAYQSMNPEGKLVRGRLRAANLADLEVRLRRIELDLVDGSPQERGKFSLGFGKVKRKDLINFCFHLEQLTSAGVPLLEGLGDLRDGATNPSFKETVADIIESIEGGMQLSAALEQHDDVFNQTFSSLIRAGEHSGTLPQVFRHLTETLKWQDELASHTKKIIMYPAMVGTVVLGVMVFLMMYLVPQLTVFIQNMGQELPLHTRLLIVVSKIFVNYWPLLLALPIGTLVAAIVAIRTSPMARYHYDQYLLRVWLIGPILHKIILARFTTFFAIMYGSGITVLECLRLSEQIANNSFVGAGVHRATQLISEGNNITDAFDQIRIFPPLVIRMLKVGESTGALESALRNAAYFYDREVKEQIGKLQTIIEPAMTVVLGLLLGWIMLSVLGPIYDTISKIKT